MDKLGDLPWSLLQVFVAVAETGSLSAGARRLGMSQPTLGRHVQTLEDALGVAVFRRMPKGMALTEVGAALLEPAQAMQVAAQKLSHLAAGEAQDLSGTVRITCSIFVAHHVLPPVLAALRLSSPEIEIELVASDTTENLLFREADIALRMYRPEQLDMVTRQLGSVALALFAAKSYLARRGRPSGPQDIVGHDIVGYDTSDLIIRGMRAAGLPATRDWFPVRCDHQTAYWELVRAGCGIGFCQAATGQADPLVEEIDLGVELPHLPVWLTTHERLRHTPRVARVWAHLAEHLGAVLDPRAGAG